MTRSVAILTAINFVAMGAGFLREVAIAYHFGTTSSADAFAVTLLLIEGLTLLALTGLGSYMMVPMVTRLIKEGPSGAEYDLMQSLCLLLALISIPIALGTLYRPDILASLLAPEFSSEQHRVLASLLRITLPAIPIVLVTGVLAGVLQAKADYFTPVIGRAIFSITIAGTVLWWAKPLGIVSAAYGVFLGATLQFLFQATMLYKGGWRPGVPSLWNNSLPASLRFGLPTLLALTLTNILMGNMQRALASGLPEGSMAAINYSQRILSLVANLSLAIGTVSLTEMSVEFSKSGLSEKSSQVLKRSIEGGIFLLAPLSILLYFYSDSISTIIFRRGNFDELSVMVTANCLRWFSVSIVPAMALAVLLRAYPALWRPWSVVWISLFWLSSTVAATWLLLPLLKTQAVPAAYSLGVLSTMCVAYVGLRRILGSSFSRTMGRYSLQISFCCGIPLAIVVLFFGSDHGRNASAADTLIGMGPSVVVFLVTFLAMCCLCRDYHVISVWNLPSLVRVRRHIGSWI